MDKKFLIPVVDVDVLDDEGNVVSTTKHVIEEDSDGRKFVRVLGKVIYLEEE